MDWNCRLKWFKGSNGPPAVADPINCQRLSTWAKTYARLSMHCIALLMPLQRRDGVEMALAFMAPRWNGRTCAVQVLPNQGLKFPIRWQLNLKPEAVRINLKNITERWLNKQTEKTIKIMGGMKDVFNLTHFLEAYSCRTRKMSG